MGAWPHQIHGDQGDCHAYRAFPDAGVVAGGALHVAPDRNAGGCCDDRPWAENYHDPHACVGVAICGELKGAPPPPDVLQDVRPDAQRGVFPPQCRIGNVVLHPARVALTRVACLAGIVRSWIRPRFQA